MTMVTNKRYDGIKQKICNGGQFCEDVMMIGLSITVLWVMILSIGQMTV